MKKIFLFSFVLISNLCFSQIPDLARRTLKGQLNPNDFDDQLSYLVNVDTLNISNAVLSGDIVYYNTKSEMITKLSNTLKGFDKKEITYFTELKDNSVYYPSKLHWYMLIDKYRIDWWFSEKDSSKLKSITLVK